MIVQKTALRSVQTLEHGPFQLREVVHECAAGCRRPDGSLVMRRAAASAQRLLPGRSVGYDVMVGVPVLRMRSMPRGRSPLIGLRPRGFGLTSSSMP